MKRIFDFILSAGLILIFSPFFILISLTVKLTSKGPIFFAQRRIGKDNKEFILYKYRTMRLDAPNIATHLFQDPDQYITLVGKFLRKSSLDELPQLINILKGEMTFVGPRPALYNQYDLNEMRTKVGVHTLLPGVTGWAQVNGRDELNLKEKVECDYYYLRNKSVALDLKIIILTFTKVIQADGILEGTNQSVQAQNDKANV